MFTTMKWKPASEMKMAKDERKEITNQQNKMFRFYSFLQKNEKVLKKKKKLIAFHQFFQFTGENYRKIIKKTEFLNQATFLILLCAFNSHSF
jgi:hypothetical protein